METIEDSMVSRDPTVSLFDTTFSILQFVLFKVLFNNTMVIYLSASITTSGLSVLTL